MTIDGRIITFLETKVTHPIQREYGWTNFWLARWTAPVIIIFWFLLFLFGSHAPDSTFLKVFCFVHISTSLFYFFVLWKEFEQDAFRRLEKGMMNPCKTDASFVFTRFVVMTVVVLIAFQSLPFFNPPLDVYGMVVILVCASFFMYLLCLDPIPRSEEKQKVPVSAIAHVEA